MGSGYGPFAESDDGRVTIRVHWGYDGESYEVLLATYDKEGREIRCEVAGDLLPDHIYDTYEETLHVAARLTESTIRLWVCPDDPHETEGPSQDEEHILVEAGPRDYHRIHWPNVQRLRQRDVDRWHERRRPPLEGGVFGSVS